MNETASTVVNIDGSQDQGGITTIINSPAGASGFGLFKWPFSASGYDAEIGDWLKNTPEHPPRELGEYLFDLVFPTKPRQTLLSAIQQSVASSKALIGIQASSPELHRIPFEISHTGKEYLASGNRLVFRLINDGTGIEPRLHGLHRFLVVLAEPESTDYDKWGHDQFVDEIKAKFKNWNIVPKILTHAKPEDVHNDLISERNQERSYDLILVVAHGEAASPLDSGQLVLEDEHGGPSPYSAEAFASALTGHRGCHVFLCACSSAEVVGENPLAGVAQRLITAGQAGSVVAMQRPVTVDAGLKVSTSFLSSLQSGSDIFEAYRDSTSLVANGSWEHGVPCLYARQGSDEETMRLRSFLSVDPKKSRVAINFPAWQMGVKPAVYSRAMEEWIQIPKGQTHYRGRTAPMTAINGAKDLIATLGRLFPVDDFGDRIVIGTDERTQDMLDEGIFTHYVLFGTQSHAYVRNVLQQYSRDFEFHFGGEQWSLIDKRTSNTYSVQNPSLLHRADASGMDYALIEKIIDEISDRVIFVIGGMWDTSSLTAGRYLIEHREKIYRKFGGGGFQYVLEIPAGSTLVKNVVIERSPLRAA